jgi:hypothetical protein
MEDPPEDYNICPSCGTEFGVNDVNSTIADLRRVWFASGPRWWSPTDQIPIAWDPVAQLRNLFLAEQQAEISKRPFVVGEFHSEVYPASLKPPEDVTWQLDRSPDSKPAASSLGSVENLSFDGLSLTAA